MSANVLKVVVTKDEKAQDFTRKHTTPQLPKWDMDISMVVSHVRGCVLSYTLSLNLLSQNNLYRKYFYLSVTHHNTLFVKEV